MSVNDSSTWPEFAKIDPELEALIKSVGGKFPNLNHISDIKERREIMGRMMAKKAAEGPAPDYTGVKKSKIQIPVRDGSTINALLYQPENAPRAGSALVVLFHPGGFVLGAPEMEEQLALQLVKDNGVVALSVDYRLAPEYPFPTPVEDSYDAVKWAAANASTIGANPEQGFIIGGDSAGATISAVISHLARDENHAPPLTGVWLNIPATITKEALPEKYKSEHTSYDQNKDAPLFGEEETKPLLTYYSAPKGDPRNNPLIWPGGHNSLPPHFIQVAGLDMLRDDGLLYERELRSEGVKTRIHVYPGVTHSFDGMFPHLKIAQKFFSERSDGFGWLLNGGKS